MKTRTKMGLMLALIIAIAVIAIALWCMQINPGKAFAEEQTGIAQTEDYAVVNDVEIVEAIYAFTALNETECSVRMTNKSVATKAVIPSHAEIDGKKYRVTEIANNGFMTATKLVRVSLPSTVKKIGSSAFVAFIQMPGFWALFTPPANSYSIIYVIIDQCAYRR